MPQRGFQAVSLEQALADAMAVRERREADRLRAEQEAEAARLEYERTRRRTKGEVAQDVGAQLLSGAVGLGQFAYGLSNMSTGGYLTAWLGCRITSVRLRTSFTGGSLPPLRYGQRPPVVPLRRKASSLGPERTLLTPY